MGTHSIPDWLCERTFIIEHNVNADKPFVVHMMAPGTARQTKEALDETFEVVGTGVTVNEAAQAAHQAYLRKK